MSARETRFPWPDADAMDTPQRQLADRLKRASNGGTGGPAGLLLRSPATAERLHALIHHLLTQSALPRRLAEWAILIQAKLWDQDYEWWAHEHLALHHGIGAAVIADLAAGRRPGSMAEDEAAVYDFCVTLDREHRIDDDLFDRVLGVLGDTAMADLTMLFGTYATISMILCVADAHVNETDPLPAPGG
jgi:4-carboxymuconolactone decarboxylase